MLAEQIKNKELLEKSINEMKKENPAANLQLLEKTIGALYLVENLANNRLDFIFKGGTSLVLLLNDLKRFSVDVDIITEETSEKVLQCIKDIVQKNDLFTRYEENIRDFLNFVFDDVLDNIKYYELPEDTSLQKVLKKKILNKEKLHLGLGILKKE